MARKDGKDRGIFEHPKGSGAWWVLYYAGGKRHREKVGTKTQAKLVYGKRKAEIREGRFFPPTDRGPAPFTIEQAAEDYLATHKQNRSRKTDLWHAEMVSAAFGHRLVQDLKAAEVERWRAARAEDTSPTTSNHSLEFLQRVCRRAVEHGHATACAALKVRKLKQPSGRVRYLNIVEEQRLRDQLPEWAWILVEFAFHTGLRRGEQFTLRWTQVDFISGLITIPRSKNGEVRHVRMNSRVRAILRALPSRMKSEWVWPSSTGRKWLDAASFTERVFRPAVRRAEFHDFHWHDLRHTFASRMIMAGKGLVAVQQLMGHKTIQMTLRYAHLAPAHLEDAVESLVNWVPLGASPESSPESGQPPEQPSARIG